MAKKVVASLKAEGGKTLIKVIKCEKSKKTGAYTFKDNIVTSDDLKEYLEKK